MSTRPTISSKLRKPIWAMYCRTCSAMKKKKLMAFSGVPRNLARNAGSCVAMPTGQVLRWHLRIMMQPSATSGAVEKPNSSAPSSAAIVTSRPVCSLPSVCRRIRPRRSFITSTWCASASPSSQGAPACLMELSGLAPVPPLSPEIRITSACALATPAGRLRAGGAASRAEPSLGFSAFARIALAPDTVHGDGQSLVRFLGDRAIAHGARGEPLDNLAGRFHLFQRNRFGRRLDLQQSAQCAQLARLAVDQVAVFLEGGEALRAHRCLQLLYGQRIVQVVVATHAELIAPAHRQFRIEVRLRRERVLVLENGLVRQRFQPHPLNPAGRAGEVFVHQPLAQPNRLEHLRAAIALQRGDAHLAEGLQQALVDALDEVRHGLLFGANRL